MDQNLAKFLYSVLGLLVATCFLVSALILHLHKPKDMAKWTEISVGKLKISTASIALGMAFLALLVIVLTRAL